MSYLISNSLNHLFTIRIFSFWPFFESVFQRHAVSQQHYGKQQKKNKNSECDERSHWWFIDINHLILNFYKPSLHPRISLPIHSLNPEAQLPSMRSRKSSLEVRPEDVMRNNEPNINKSYRIKDSVGQYSYSDKYQNQPSMFSLRYHELSMRKHYVTGSENLSAPHVLMLISPTSAPHFHPKALFHNSSHQIFFFLHRMGVSSPAPPPQPCFNFFPRRKINK